MKLHAILLILLCTLEAAKFVEASSYEILKIGNCSSSNEDRIVFERWEVASTQSINITVNAKHPVNKALVRISDSLHNEYYADNFNLFYEIQVSFYTELNSEFRQVFKVPHFEWCGMMSGAKNSNNMVRTVIESLKEICPVLIQKCPYIGRFEIVNVKIPKKVSFIFPTGKFRIDILILEGLSNSTSLFFSILLEVFSQTRGG